MNEDEWRLGAQRIATERDTLRNELARERAVNRVYAEQEAALEEQAGRYLARAQRAEATVLELQEELARLRMEMREQAQIVRRAFTPVSDGYIE